MQFHLQITHRHAVAQVRTPPQDLRQFVTAATQFTTTQATVAPAGNVTRLSSTRQPPAQRRKKRTLTCNSGESATSSTDRAHGSSRLDKAWPVDSVARRLTPHRRPPRQLQGIVIGTAAQQGEQIGLPRWQTGNCEPARRPSGVRSHSEQNACDTEAMIPTVAGPPLTRHNWAGDEPRRAGSTLRSNVSDRTLRGWCPHSK